MTATTEKVYCSAETMTWSRGRGYKCDKAAKGDDGLCGVHHNREQRHADLAERWRRQDEQVARRRAQAAYVEQWRSEHPAEMFVDAWMCPLCKSAVQVAVTPREFAWDQGEQIEAHQQSHGDDWTAYLEAGE